MYGTGSLFVWRCCLAGVCRNRPPSGVGMGKSKGRRKYSPGPGSDRRLKLESSGFVDAEVDDEVSDLAELNTNSDSEAPPSQDLASTSASKTEKWSLKGSPNPFLSGKGFPILSDLQAKGVLPKFFPLIWLRIVDWERPENRIFKAEAIDAAAKGQTELDLFLKIAADNFGFDMKDLERQRLEEASLIISQTKPDLEMKIDEVLANSPSTFLSEVGRRAYLPPISEDPHTGDSPIASESGTCKKTRATSPDASIETVDYASDVLLDAVVGKVAAFVELFAAVDDSKKVVDKGSVATVRKSANKPDDSAHQLNPHQAALASVIEASKGLYSNSSEDTAHKEGCNSCS